MVQQWWWHVTENVPQHQLFRSWIVGSAGAFSLKLEATAAWLVGDMLCSRTCATREELWEEFANQIASGRKNSRYGLTETLQRQKPKPCESQDNQRPWTTGEWRILKWRTLETFMTFLAMERLWNKEGNGVMSLQACWPRKSRSDSWNISIQTHAA